MNIRRFLQLLNKVNADELSTFKSIHIKRTLKVLLGILPIVLVTFVICNFKDLNYTVYDVSNVTKITEVKQVCSTGEILQTEVPYFNYETKEPVGDHTHDKHYIIEGKIKYISGFFNNEDSKEIKNVEYCNEDKTTIIVTNSIMLATSITIFILFFAYFIFSLSYIFGSDYYDHPNPSAPYYFWEYYNWRTANLYYNYTENKDKINVISTINYFILYIKVFFNIPVTLYEVQQRLSLFDGFKVIHKGENTPLTDSEIDEYNKYFETNVNYKLEKDGITISHNKIPII